jgi:hypothetical protein
VRMHSPGLEWCLGKASQNWEAVGNSHRSSQPTPTLTNLLATVRNLHTTAPKNWGPLSMIHLSTTLLLVSGGRRDLGRVISGVDRGRVVLLLLVMLLLLELLVARRRGLSQQPPYPNSPSAHQPPPSHQPPPVPGAAQQPQYTPYSNLGHSGGRRDLGRVISGVDRGGVVLLLLVMLLLLELLVARRRGHTTAPKNWGPLSMIHLSTTLLLVLPSACRTPQPRIRGVRGRAVRHSLLAGGVWCVCIRLGWSGVWGPSAIYIRQPPRIGDLCL